MIEISKTSMRRSKPSYFFSILGVASLLILVGILGWFVINGSKLERYFRGSVQVQVYLRENAPQADIDSLISYIRSKPYASAAEHVTKEMAKEKFIKEGNEDWNKVLDYNPLPASIDFNLKSEYVNKDTLTNITADLSQNIIVSDIRYPDEVVEWGEFRQNLHEVVAELPGRQLIVARVFVDNYEDFRARDTYAPLAELVGKITGKLESVVAVKNVWLEAKKKIVAEMTRRGFNFLEAD